MVFEMLQEGIITPSTSSFSSLIFLIKKKDRTWHFYTDYQSLDAITIKKELPYPHSR